MSVGGSTSYQIKPLKKFEKTFQALIKTHYRKDKEARSEFEALIASFVQQLANEPCCHSAERMAFPGQWQPEGWELRKQRWRRLPGLRGQAAFGRLIYVVCHPEKMIYLVWLYTHAEFGKPKSQPPSKELNRVLRSIEAESERE